MRAAHSLKGAARIVGLDAGVGVAHAMEDCFVAAQTGSRFVGPGADRPAAAAAWICWRRIAKTPEGDRGQAAESDKPEVDAFVLALSRSRCRPEQRNRADP